MKFETVFSIGSKAFIWNNQTKMPIEVTIGQISVMHRDSIGRGDPEEIFDNYKPQKKHEETYMCDETGIGSGQCFTLYESIFATQKECADYYLSRTK